MTASSDDKLILMGDKAGYTTLFDVETREKKCYYCHHKNKVYNVLFTPDN